MLFFAFLTKKSPWIVKLSATKLGYEEIYCLKSSSADSAEISNRINTDNDQDQDQQGDNAETNFEYSDDRDGDDQ